MYGSTTYTNTYIEILVKDIWIVEYLKPHKNLELKPHNLKDPVLIKDLTKNYYINLHVLKYFVFIHT